MNNNEAFFLMAGPARGHLAPWGDLLVAKKVVIVSIFTFLESRMEFYFSRFLTLLAAQRAPQRRQNEV